MESNPHDLTILYTEDTVQWCEYLFDIFKDFEIQQNSEDISDFPTNLNTLQSIKESLVTVVIISPLFLQNLNPKMHNYLNQVVGLICGVDDADMEELARKLPSVKDWHHVDAVAGSSEISKLVFKVLHEAGEEKQRNMVADTEDTYLTISDEPEFIQSDYIEMVGGKPDNDRPENTYFSPPARPGRPDVPGAPEEFYEEMRPVTSGRPPAAPVGSSHVFQTTSKGYVDMKEARHLSQCSAGLTIHPEKARSGDAGVPLYILFQDPIVSVKFQDQYFVSFQGIVKKSEVLARQRNPYTLQVDLPKDHPAELTDVQVTGPNRAVLGTFKFIFTSVMDDLADLLRDVVDPLKFMCQSLGISPGDANELDNKLYEHIQKCIPTAGLNLLVGQIGEEQKVFQEVPTALHFAAKYGLKNICSMLINCPGAVQAMKLKNSRGDTPDIMADKGGHNDLKSFLQNFMEVAEDGEGIDPEDGKPSSYMSMKSGLYYYNQAHFLKQLHGDQLSDYDSPFHVPIPAPGAETIKKLVQGELEDIEEYYGSVSIDMASFNRDKDAEEDYEKVEEQSRPRQQYYKPPGVNRPPPRQPFEEKPTLLETVIPPRLPPLSEPDVEATEKYQPKKNVQASNILGLQPLAAGQQHLIEIQNRVKNSEVTVDEAVLLFRNWEQLQETDRLSFSNQEATFKAIKQQKQKQGAFGGFFGKKTHRKGLRNNPMRTGRAQSEPIICSPYGQQTPLQVMQKPQERLIQTESSVQNRPTSTTSLDSHGSRDSSYNSAPDEPDQERYPPHPTPSTVPVARTKGPSMSQQDRIKRLSGICDQLPHFTQKPLPPMPSRSIRGSVPPALKNLPKPSPPTEQPTYLEFDEPTPEDLPGLPPPPPPTEQSPKRLSDSTSPTSLIQAPRSTDSPASKYPSVAPRQPVPAKRPIPKPRNPPK